MALTSRSCFVPYLSMYIHTELGIVNNAVVDVWHEAQALGKRIAANGPLGVRGAKKVIEGK